MEQRSRLDQYYHSDTIVGDLFLGSMSYFLLLEFVGAFVDDEDDEVGITKEEKCWLNDYLVLNIFSFVYELKCTVYSIV